MLCECGCGERTNLAPQTVIAKGWIKGESMRFIKGHQCRLSPVEYLEQDMGYETPCWVWQRSIAPSGYGGVRVAGKTRTAHSVYYERVNGPVPVGTELDHLCRVRSCCNPAHLEAVPHTINARRGARTILSVFEVRDIKRLLGQIPQWRLARQFCVSPGAIADISAGRTWKEGTL